jgi:hypothetical protein
MQAGPPRPAGHGGRRDRAGTDHETRDLVAGRLRVVNADVDPRSGRLAGNPQVAARVHDRPGETGAERLPRREIHRPALRHTAEIQPDVRGQQDLVAVEGDVAPSPSRPPGSERNARPREHVVEVPVVPSGDHRVEHRRVEPAPRAPCRVEGEREESRERRRHTCR